MKGTTKIIVATGLGVALGMAIDAFVSKQPMYKALIG